MPAGYSAILWSSEAAGTQLANSTTQTSILNAGDKYTLPAGFLDKLGKKLRIRASGNISCVVTTPGTLLFQVLFGATNVAAMPAVNLNTTAKTSVTWELDWYLRLSAKGGGTSATFAHWGKFISEAVVGSAANTAGGNGLLLFPTTSPPTTGGGFDNTVANVIDLQAKFSVNTAGTNITLAEYELWSDN
jgi:hypothetical protein